jgi:transcriptional regulator with XRE-family HTH domain
MPKGSLRNRLRNRIAFMREVRGLTQAQLAHLLGVSESTIARWEMDVHMPAESMVGKLARALRCRPRDLFPWDFV